MDALGFLGLILLGLLLAPLMLKLLQQMLPLIQTRLAVILPCIADLTRRAFRWAGHLITEEAELSPSRTVAQVAGAILLIAAGVPHHHCRCSNEWTFALDRGCDTHPCCLFCP